MGNYKLKSNSWNRYCHCARCQRYRSIVNWPPHPLTRYNGLKNPTHTGIHTCRQRWQLSKSYWAIALAIVESRLRCAKTQKPYRDNNSANSHSRAQFHFYSRCPFRQSNVSLVSPLGLQFAASVIIHSFVHSVLSALILLTFHVLLPSGALHFEWCVKCASTDRKVLPFSDFCRASRV